MKNWAIDLGTTNSAISYSTQDKCVVIELENQKKSLPSSVLLEDGRLKSILKRDEKIYKNKNNIIFEEWKISGMVDEITANKPFALKKGIDTSVATPINLSAKIIETLVHQAEKRTGEKIENISVSIPANFKEPARLNTIAAVKKAIPGIKEVKLIHEPTAAAASILVEYNVDALAEKNILVYDMGGGTLDISVVKFAKEGSKIGINVTGTSGLNVAGKTMDNVVLNKFIFPAIADEFDFNKSHLINDVNVVNQLLYWAEKLKLDLSTKEGDVIDELEFNFKGNTYKLLMRIKYVEFLKAISGVILKSYNKLDEALQKMNIDKRDIELVVTAGSSTRAPWIKKSINDYFGRNIISSIVDPEGAISAGGAILAGINHNAGLYTFRGNEIAIKEIAPTNIGVQVSGFINSWMINKGAQLPIKVSKSFWLRDSTIAFPEIIVVTDDKKRLTWECSDILAIIEAGKKIKVISSEKLEVELVYDDRMSITLNIIYDGERYDFTPTSDIDIKEQTIKKHEATSSTVVSIVKNMDMNEEEFNDYYIRAVDLFERNGHDVSYYKTGEPSLLEKQTLIWAFRRKPGEFSTS